MKIDRLFAITNIIVDRKAITATELAEHFGVSVRTIYRDIDILCTNGIPIYTLQGKGGGISIVDSYTIDKTLLSDEEQKQILMALHSIKATGQVDVSDSIAKLRSLFHKDAVDWIEIDFSNWEQSQTDKEIFNALKESIINMRAISFTYYGNNGSKSERIVEPFKLILKGYSWYLHGYCRYRDDYRFFKLSRMDKLVVLEESFNRISPKQNHTDHKLYDTIEMVNLSLRVDANYASRVYDEFRHGKIVLNQNYLLVEVEIPKSDWMYNNLLGYGNALEVLGPPDVRQRVVDLLNEISGKYK